MKSHLETLAEIKAFVHACKKDPELMGFNVKLSKHRGRSYVLGKTFEKAKPKYVLAIDLDYFQITHQQMIDATIYEAIHNREMPPEEMENLIITKWN